MNILVTGAGGQLGCSLRKKIGKGSTKACLPLDGNWWYFSDISKREGFPTYFLDITDPEEIGRMVKDLEIDAIVNCAAWTDVEKAEDCEDKATLVNADAAGYLAEAMAATGGLMVHISSDYVLAGSNTPCREDAPLAPQGAYARTKLQGEREVISAGCKHVILRTSWLYSEFGRNFLRTMHSLTAERSSVRVVFDQVGTPTYASDLAEAIIAVITDYAPFASSEEYPRGGTYHFSDEGVCSWYDFAKMIAEYSGHTGCEILPCHSDEYPSKVIRPSYSVLDKTLIKDTFALKIPHWTDSLKECISLLEA